uniref:Fatty acid desaturase domain-containing protein n=1 Tax=Alexandrium catenella TaxID=2925 RepID=A0A7S1LID2_ALECA
MALCREGKELPVCPLGDFKLPASFTKHPGGQSHLKVARESDCPGELFLSYHLASDMDKVAAAANALGVAMPQRGPVFDEIYAMVSRLKMEHPMHQRIFTVWCITLSIALQATAVWWILSPTLLSSIVTSQVFEMYFFNIFHTRHHKGGRLYNIDVLDGLFGCVYDFVDNVWGHTPLAWYWNHQVLHHCHTNEVGLDTDMSGLYPVFRTKSEQQRSWFHKLQTFYWPFFLPFVIIALPPYNLFMNGGKPIAFAAWFLIMVVWPLSMHGVYALALSFFIQAITGISMSYKFAVSHTHYNLGAEEEGSNHKTIDKWLKAQVEEAQSWGGYLSCLLFGGINMQIEHHLAPALTPLLYALMRPELQKICQERGIRYTYEPSMMHATWRFHHQLWNMGQEEPLRNPAKAVL